MKVILLMDVKKLGKKDQIIEVSDGYAMNYLIPHRIAVKLTNKSQEILSNQQADEKRRQEERKAEAQSIVEKLKDITLEFSVQTGKDGKMFGNISGKQIADLLENNYKISIDKRKFIDKSNLDILGYHHLKIELYKGVIGVVNVHIKSKGE